VATSQTKLSWDVLLDLGPPESGPLHERLKNTLRQAVTRGQLREGTMLPPSRQLALDLGCSRATVTEAYGQLVAEGYLEARTGSGTRVRWTRNDSAPPASERPASAPLPRFDLAPGLPDLRAFPRAAWARAQATQLTSITDAELGYPAPGGHLRLRALLADHLNRARGANTRPDTIVVCPSVTEAVRRICGHLRRLGIDELGFEEPGWSRLRAVARSAGVTPVPIPVDGDGLRVDLLARLPRLRAVVVTPAHQYPSGSVLAPHRRADLLAWARERDGVIIEDDYDAEFRYDRRPVGTLQGMDDSRVLLLKSLSKVLSPALGLGWMAVPPLWAAELRASTPSTPDQLTFASFLSSGAYDRHLRASRLRYRRRRDLVVTHLTERLPHLTIDGVAAGLHLVLRLPPGVDAGAVVAEAAHDEVAVTNLAGSYEQPPRSPGGLILGYANIPDVSVPEAVARLAAAYARA
jgi:GntR family transcriptional regulator/MocR family aminotransferase